MVLNLPSYQLFGCELSKTNTEKIVEYGKAKHSPELWSFLLSCLEILIPAPSLPFILYFVA